MPRLARFAPSFTLATCLLPAVTAFGQTPPPTTPSPAVPPAPPPLPLRSTRSIGSRTRR